MSATRMPSKGIRKRRWGKTLRDFWKRLLRPPGGLRNDFPPPARYTYPTARFSYRTWDDTPVSHTADFWRVQEDGWIGLVGKEGEVEVHDDDYVFDRARQAIRERTGAINAYFRTDVP